jgi:hypothetical protein
MSEAYAWASSLMPANTFYLDRLLMGMKAWLDEQERQKPLGFPEVCVEILSRHYPMLPQDTVVAFCAA